MSFFSFLRSSGAAQRTPDHMTPADFVARHDPDAVVIDVRTDGEYRSGHLAGAKQIDIGSPDFARRVEALDRDRTYYLYCRSGNRSGHAARIMRDLGFERVYNIGGIGELSRAGAEIVRP